jgi:hypothetical protein
MMVTPTGKCTVCNKPITSLVCQCGHKHVLSPEQHADLSAVWKMFNRITNTDKDDTHTNGPTGGIVSAPQWAFDIACQLAGGPFDLDVAALPDNTKAPRFFTPEQDGLKQRWNGKRIWCNPPYHLDYLIQWIEKAYKAARHGATVVCLLPFWPGSDWMRYIIKGQIVFIYDGCGFPCGLGAMNYVLCLFQFTRPRTWFIGQCSKAKGLEVGNL